MGRLVVSVIWASYCFGTGYAKITWWRTAPCAFPGGRFREHFANAPSCQEGQSEQSWAPAAYLSLGPFQILSAIRFVV